jgi:hypothetical protein
MLVQGLHGSLQQVSMGAVAIVELPVHDDLELGHTGRIPYRLMTVATEPEGTYS